jgi:hypothetical protein
VAADQVVSRLVATGFVVTRLDGDRYVLYTLTAIRLVEGLI